MSESNFKLSFEIVRDGEVVRTEELDQDVIKIGKLASSHLRLEDDNVSRIHAVIEKASDGSYSVIDLGSASGTYVNDEKVTKSEVSSGDELRFGDTTVRLEFVEAGGDMEFGGTADQTMVSDGLDEKLDEDRAEAAGEAQTSQQDGGQATATSGGTIELEDGTEVEPYTLQGYYDDGGNYIPGYYDETGEYHLGYGYYDDQGEWKVSFGYYDPQGEWVDTDEPVESVAGQGQDEAASSASASAGASASYRQGPSASEIYEEQFFESSGGDTLEVAMLWSDQVLSVSSFSEARTVTIGPDWENDFIFEDASIQGEDFPLVSFDGGSYTLVVTPDMRGHVQNADEQFTIDEAIEQGIARQSSKAANAYEISLGRRTVARVDLGRTTFLVHFTDMPAAIGGGLPFDTAPLPYVGMSAVAHIAFLLLSMSIPADSGNLNFDSLQADDRFAQMLVKPDKEEEEEKPNWLDDAGDEEQAAKHKGEEGKAGKEDSEQEDKRMAIKGPPSNKDLELKKARDTKIAQNAGVMKVFQDNQVTSMWGNSSQSVGSDAIHALGNMEGDSAGNAKGFGGLGLSGSGRGGGGVSERGIGMANVGTAGRGGGGRGGSGYGKGAGDLGDRKSKIPQVVPGKPLVTGSLDKEIIRRVIRKHRREIKFCYEQELQKNKALTGQVTMNFTISATGNVIAAKTKKSSLNNTAVESCMASKIRRWVFPEPKGGGIVIVNYPFNFSSN
ncbi:MAG: AgmX/PglI C-terminal domain-containing protein [Myxococcota bacterium]